MFVENINWNSAVCNFVKPPVTFLACFRLVSSTSRSKTHPVLSTLPSSLPFFVYFFSLPLPALFSYLHRLSFLLSCFLQLAFVKCGIIFWTQNTFVVSCIRVWRRKFLVRFDVCDSQERMDLCPAVNNKRRGTAGMARQTFHNTGRNCV